MAWREIECSSGHIFLSESDLNPVNNTYMVNSAPCEWESKGIVYAAIHSVVRIENKIIFSHVFLHFHWKWGDQIWTPVRPVRYWYILLGTLIHPALFFTSLFSQTFTAIWMSQTTTQSRWMIFPHSNTQRKLPKTHYAINVLTATVHQLSVSCQWVISVIPLAVI